jgi:WD40 repeat protein
MSSLRSVRFLLAASFLGLVPFAGNGQEPREAPLPEGAIARLGPGGSPLLFSSDGKWLLATSAKEAHVLTLWDVATRKSIREFVGPKQPGILIGTFVYFTAAAFDADARTLATGSSDGSLRLWDVATGKEIRQWAAHKDFVHQLDLSADGKTLVSHGWYGNDGTVKVWDATTGKERLELPEKGGRMPKIPRLSPSGKEVAVVNDSSGFLTLWDATSGAMNARFRVNHNGNLVAISYHPDGKSLLVTNFANPGSIHRYDMTTGKELAEFATQKDIRSTSFSKDFSIVATLTQREPDEKTVHIWDVATGKLRGVLTADSQLWTVAIAPDGKSLATHGNAPGGILLWKMPSP